MTKHCWLKFRWFHSKGAALVLIWSLLTIASNRILHKVLAMLTLDSGGESSLPTIGTAILVFVLTPFFGWLADARLGNYKVVKIGITLSLLGSILLSLFSLLYYNTSLRSNQYVALRNVLSAVISLLQWKSTVIVFTNCFQLGLEQMPDASAENITSLIAWFVFALTAGVWAGDVIKDTLLACVNYNQSDLRQVLTLFPVIIGSANFIIFHFIHTPKWLIIEPNSPQSLKNIYRVLKFAAKHKAPLNRSALTYWEEDIPSRLDLGKSRYGGPFTTEQVEDVKTFFRILTVSVGIFLTEFALVTHEYDYYSLEVFNFTNINTCKANALFLFTLHPFWCGILTVLVYEFLIYPCFKYRLPGSMKKIGMVSLVVVLRNITYLIENILVHFNIVEKGAPWMLGINSVMYGILLVTLTIPSLEFICAQAPYCMRGLMSGYMQLILWLAFIFGNVFSSKFLQYCQTPSCYLAYASVGAAIGIFAFLVYLIIAHWYKRRVRDDIDTPHKWVEDVYDRYLTAAGNS